MINAINTRKEFFSTFLMVLCYGLGFYFIQFFIFKIGVTSILPNDVTLIRWDAPIYKDVATKGYDMKTTGVMVLFPMIWRILHVGYAGMAIANFVLFAVGFSLICSVYQVSVNERFLWLTTPSLYFMWVPYTEATFCLLTAFCFYGIVKRNRWLIWSSLFLLCLCRATAFFLLPSLLVMELLTNSKKDIFKALIDYCIYYALPILLGTVTFILIQYFYTGAWMPYYKGQVKNLGHELSIPVLPFSDFYGGARVTWLNAFALFVCFIALVLVIIKICRWLFRGVKENDKVWVLTLSYLPLILFTMVFCNPKWGSETTNLLGMHRYTFCSPFIFVFFYYMVNKAKEYKLKHFVLVFILANLVWFSMGAYVHIQEMLFYNFITLLIMGYMFYANNKNSLVSLAIFGINLFLQIMIFQQFIAGPFTD